MTKTDNRTTGGRFEQVLSWKLAEAGFWVHVLQQNKAGQPADMIAIRGKFHTLIDCKVISDNNGFPFERVEENQKCAMQMFHRKASELCYFALRLPDGSIWMISSARIETLRARGKKRLTEKEIREGQAWSLEAWLNTKGQHGDDEIEEVLGK